jgi:hypothetical protein
MRIGMLDLPSTHPRPGRPADNKKPARGRPLPVSINQRFRVLLGPFSELFNVAASRPAKSPRGKNRLSGANRSRRPSPRCNGMPNGNATSKITSTPNRKTMGGGRMCKSGQAIVARVCWKGFRRIMKGPETGLFWRRY